MALDFNAWRQGLGGMSRHDLFNLGPTGTGTANDIVSFVKIGNVWYEKGRSVNG